MSDEKLPPGADLTEALARAQEPRRLWPVLHAVDAPRTEPETSGVAMWLVWCLTTGFLLLAGASMGRC